MFSHNRVVFGLSIALVALSLLGNGCGKSQEQKGTETAEGAFAEIGAFTDAQEEKETKREALMKKRTIRLGQSITLQSLKITPIKEFRKVRSDSYKVKDEGPHLVVTLRVKNISEGEVFDPNILTAFGEDSFGNQIVEAPKYDHCTTPGSHRGDVLPGQEVDCLFCMSRKIASAKWYVLEITSRVSNKSEGEYEHWRLKFDVSEVVVVDASEPADHNR